MPKLSKKAKEGRTQLVVKKQALLSGHVSDNLKSEIQKLNQMFKIQNYIDFYEKNKSKECS